MLKRRIGRKMEAKTEMARALEEILLRHRALIDQALYALEETAPAFVADTTMVFLAALVSFFFVRRDDRVLGQLDGLLHHFEEAVLDLQKQEPSFWQLRFVENVRNLLKARVADHVRANVSAVVGDSKQDPVAVHASVTTEALHSAEFRETLQQTYDDVQGEIARLTSMLDSDNDEQNDPEGTGEHFLDTLWKKLEDSVAMKETRPEEEEGEAGVSVAEFDSCSFEMLTFDDDFNDISRSASSLPCLEDIPATIQRMQSSDEVERDAGLSELMQMPILEIVHCGPAFPAVCVALSGLFLDTNERGEGGDVSGISDRAKRVIYDLMNHVEDAGQFLDLFWSVLDFIGSRLETGDLFLEKQKMSDTAEAHTTGVVDCFRVLLALLSRAPRYWVHFSTETLTRLFDSTLHLLIMYSASETEVEAKHVKPLVLLALIDDEHAQWFKTWLLKTPSLSQLFGALHETGFVVDLLQYLSRVRPLAESRGPHQVVAAVEKRAIQYTLSCVSYMCEYHEGRELLAGWRRISAHSHMKQRHTIWIKPELIAFESIFAENDLLYHLKHPKSPKEVRAVIGEVGAQIPSNLDERIPTIVLNVPINAAVLQQTCNELEAGYEHLGNRVLDAVILSTTAILLTAPRYERMDGSPSETTRDDEWGNQMCKSISTYIHAACIDISVSVMLELIAVTWENTPGDSTAVKAEYETERPWFPFRQAKGATEVRELIADSIATRICHGTISQASVDICGPMILAMLMSNKILMKTVITMADHDVITSIFQRCSQLLQTWHLNQASPRMQSSYRVQVLSAISTVVTSPQGVKLAHQFGIVDAIVKIHAACLSLGDDHGLSSLTARVITVISQSATGLRLVYQAEAMDVCVSYVINQWHDTKTLGFREVQDCLSVATSSMTFLRRDEVQATLFQALVDLQESPNFTMALNSPGDECPTSLGDSMGRLLWLRCCLSTQYASKILLSCKQQQSPLIHFIAATVGNHKRTCCCSSGAEDLCCVAFQMALALVSSVPAMLDCCGLFSELQILNLDDKSAPQCEWLSTSGDCLGSCTLLEQQLRYEFGFVGGSTEKLPRCELSEFDSNSREGRDISNREVTTSAKGAAVEYMSAFAVDMQEDLAVTLQKKILQTIKESTESGVVVPVDFALLTQTSWELISEVETETTGAHSEPRKSAVELTSIFGKLLYELVMSKRSCLEPTGLDAIKNAGSHLRPSADSFFPPDSERKLMNRLYKCYAQRLSLSASPTALHCVVKKFGKFAMDCFPVTILMLLHPNYEEADVLGFLSECLESPFAGFLWPKSATECNESVPNGLQKEYPTMPPAIVLAEAVESILEKEFPQILRVVDQCHCSVLTLMLRWHSQSFWNYLDWENVVLYTYLSVLYGPEFQVYIIVAILKHLEPKMRELTGKYSTQSVESFLALIREPIARFRFGPWRPLLLRLRSDYHGEVTKLLATG